MQGKAGNHFVSGFIRSLVFFLIFFSMVPAGFATDKGERFFIVDSIVGDVFIQKAAGVKEILAYQGTVFQEGDRLRTGEGSSVVISSTDRDDSLVLIGNTELFAETLSERNGVKQTRLRVLAGAAYAEVEPLYESADTFEIVNPAAAISARGTHFSISIDPVTGLPSVYVYSGVVNTGSPRQSSTPPLRVLPGQQVDLYTDVSQGTSGVVTPLDLNELTGQMNDEIIHKMLENKERIEQENEQMRQEILKGYAAQQWFEMNENGEDPEDVDRILQNIDNLIENIVKRTLESGTVNRERAEQLIEEINRQGTVPRIDLGSIPPLEDPRGEGARQALEERERLNQQKREQQEQREQQKAQYEQQNRELLERVQEQLRQQEEANRQALEEAQNNAVNRYLEQLSEAERMRFENSQRQRTEEREQAQQEREQRQSPVPPPPSSPPSGGSGGGSTPPSPPPTIVDITQPEPVKIETGEIFTPPATVEVRMSNGTTREVSVQWDGDLDTSKYGHYTLSGTIVGGGEVVLDVFVYVPYGEVIELSLEQTVIPLRDGSIEVIGLEEVPYGSETNVTVFDFTDEERTVTGLEPAGAVLTFRQFEIGGATVKLNFDVTDGANAGEVGIFQQIDDGEWIYIPTTVENGIASAEIEDFNGTYGVFYVEQVESSMQAALFRYK
ncbi:Ig-like domain-containing protein [Robertmurraya sp. FSL W8-0741]|uniref:Ig-like domain-containing protein n=1 Tax=Robertmurraya TaxID=2837507 RepID=UPI000BA5DDFE|nr:Ig-like domain-containing protein [Robertmurraya siralis]PAE21041.1 hypothetical protein CHH80_08080 [Bacillus sp. 7504-2]